MDDWNFNFWCIVVKSWFLLLGQVDSIPLKPMRKKKTVDFVAGVQIAGRFQQMCRFQPGESQPSKSHREKNPPLKPHIFSMFVVLFGNGCFLAGAFCWLVSAEFCCSSVVTVVLAAKLHQNCQNWYGIYIIFMLRSWWKKSYTTWDLGCIKPCKSWDKLPIN